MSTRCAPEADDLEVHDRPRQPLREPLREPLRHDQPILNQRQPILNLDVAKWSNSRVLAWLLSNELTHFLTTFAIQGVSGAVLLEYAEDPAKIDNMLALGSAEPMSPTLTQISALKQAVKSLADKEKAANNAPTPEQGAPKEPQAGSAQQIPKTLGDWRQIIRTSTIAHDALSRKYTFRGSMLTLLVVTLNTIVTSAIFTTISDSTDARVTIAAGIISLISAVLTSIRSAIGYETLAEAHRSAGLRYAKLWTRFDDMHGMLELPYMDADGRKKQEWVDWFKDYQDAIDTAPIIDPTAWKQAKGKEEENIKVNKAAEELL